MPTMLGLRAASPKHLLLPMLRRLHVKPVTTNRVAGMLARSVPVRVEQPVQASPVANLGMYQDMQTALRALNIEQTTEIQVCTCAVHDALCVTGPAAAGTSALPPGVSALLHCRATVQHAPTRP
jgi:hypothetical protein